MSTPSGAPTFDLQSHSTCSDGSLQPAAVVAAAAAAGVELLALTDHDTVEGVPEAQAAAEEHGIQLVAAVELSTADVLGEDFHVLGYDVDHADPVLRERLRSWCEDRALRIERMAAHLDELGLPPDRAVLDDRRARGCPIGRPHLAAAVISGNRERLRREGLDEPSAFLEAYLVAGAPAYSRRTTPTVAEAIDAIHDAGGIAVWAHPFWDLAGPEDVSAALARFAGCGLDGVEAFYVTHNGAQTQLLCGLADDLGLLTTGSADFHGPGHVRFSRFRAFDLHGLQPNLGPLAAQRPREA
jgi:predicted metal-dependent phosphoesterase TrpH